MLEVVKDLLSKLGLFSTVRKVCIGPLTTVRSYLFQKNALSTLKKLHQVLNENKIEFFLVFGTCLGAIREKKFIAHDLDIDLGVYNTTDFKKLEIILKSQKFKLISEIMLDTTNETLYQNYIDTENKISVDFYKFSRDDKHTYYYEFLRDDKLSYAETIRKNGGLFVYKYKMPLYELIKINFYKMDFFIFKDFDNFLKIFYGENYMIPIKNFDYISMAKEQEFLKNVKGKKFEYKNKEK